MKSRPRLAVLCDFREEGWLSMDLVGDMIATHLAAEHAAEYEVTKVQPRFVRLPIYPRRLHDRWLIRTAERSFNRYLVYPMWVRRNRSRFDLLHIVDHSYSHLALEAPSKPVAITCHDLNAFRCLLEPEREPRSVAFRAMTGRLLRGLKSAAAVACDSQTILDEILAHRVLSADRVSVVHNGVHPAYQPGPDAAADAQVDQLLGPRDPDALELLHVGSNRPRKRIDVLLRVFAALLPVAPKARLIKAGHLTPAQSALARDLGIEDRLSVLPLLSREVLAALYRRSTMLMLPSDNEGFGLPVIETLACRTPVLASDIPVLREVGGEAVVYSPVGDVSAWTAAATAMLQERSEHPGRWNSRRDAGVLWASRFSWSEYANRSVELYRRIFGRSAF
ncbi:glycosyltransferase family 4 protein [Candidatus Binatus sp.]|jgi:glycosyltransferase involved in cell wall biosynthesis|uniref:glycosyltransferase family 4 protein n=1 Tax=Candidatus Binatus sp. TaxID=2811406 RepID=UPI003C865A4B